MLISQKWLQTYFKDALPSSDVISDTFTKGIFEIDGMEQKGDDTVYDIKTLADRNPYALSHRYMAQELGILLKKEVVMPQYDEVTASSGVARNLSIKIEDADFCLRYIGRVVEGIHVTASPDWLKEKITVLGQRSINSIVDLTNFVMLDTGQPMHAFDADKVMGDIRVCHANDGEEIILLDGSVVKLNKNISVIADDEGPLAIAGVKGGKRAEVTMDTKNIILEAAAFNGTAVRKAAQSVNIRNDSTKRFENQITPERSAMAITEISALILKINTGAKFGALIDVYAKPVTERNVEVKASYICERIGAQIPTTEILDILKRCLLSPVEDAGTISLTIPLYRSDLVLPEDIIDEVVRIYGYSNVKGELPPPITDRKINKNFYYKNLIRQFFYEKGFSETYTHTLQDSGDFEIQNPLNVNRGFMRNTIRRYINDKLDFNLRNADLLGLTSIKIFEIGNVFAGKNEQLSLSFGVINQKNPKEYDINATLKSIVSDLFSYINATDSGDLKIEGNAAEINLASIIAILPEPTADVVMPASATNKFVQFSLYPFMVRDIAVFVPGEGNDQSGDEQKVLNIIKTHTDKTGLLNRVDLFDTFTKKKEGEPTRTSYAYRLVLQSKDRTLVDDEANAIMKSITDDMNSQSGWLVR